MCVSMGAGLVFSSDVRADTRYNLVNDYRVYTYSEYRARKQYEDALQIEVIDARSPKTEHQSQGRLLMVTDDSFWIEPVPEMLEAILFREFGLSFLFRSVGRGDIRGGLVLELTLNSFYGHTEKAGVLTRLIYGDVGFSARLIQQRSKETLFTKKYHSRTSVRLKSITKSGRHMMVEQIGNSLSEVIPALISDVEQVLKARRPPKKPRPSPTKKPERKKTEPLNLEPVGPK